MKPNIPRIFLITLLITFLTVQCKKESEEFMASQLATYYLIENNLMSTSPSDGEWIYISNYIYPESYSEKLKSCEWKVFRNKNITKGEYGYDLIFYSDSDARVKVEYILDDGSEESLIASNELNIPHKDTQTGIHCHADIHTMPLLGENPRSGKGNYLIFRVTHISGNDLVEVLYGGDTGYLGNTSISFYEDQ